MSVATDGHWVHGYRWTAELAPNTTPEQAGEVARSHEPAGELIMWVHPSAPWELAGPDDETGYTLRGSWIQLPMPGEPVWLAPAAPTDFAAAPDAGALAAAVWRFAETVGLAYAYSGGSTGHALIRTTQGRHRLQRPWPEPELENCVTAWATPAHHWTRPANDLERRGWVRAFDRNGSYLAAWSGLVLGDGPWTHADTELAVDAGTESSKPPGYWLIDTGPLADALAGYPNPFDRRGVAEGPRWLTTPLAQLAGELAAAAGVDLVAVDGWWCDTSIRPLDNAARVLRDARELLADCPPALDALKGTYVRAVAWFESGAPPGELLHRPHWRRSILDRHVANTWRRLHDTPAGPLAQSDIDAVYYPVDETGTPPPGMRLGRGLGQFKPAGPILPARRLAELLDAGDGRGFIRAYHGGDQADERGLDG